MKKTLLLTAAALTPLTLFAQNSATSFGGTAAATEPAPAASPGVPRLDEVKFDGQNFKDVVHYLLVKSQEAGADPSMNPLNIVISPGLEDRRVPDLLLRNVTPTDVLSIATTVLNLRMDPVQGDGGRIVAWVIKDNAGQDPFATAGGSSSGGGFAPALEPLAKLLTNAPPSPASPPETTPAPEDAPALAGGGGGLTVPAPVAIASSPALGGGLGMPAPAARVFGVGPLLAVTDIGSETGKKQRAEKYQRLMMTLDRLAQDQGLKADIRPYDEMDIIVVKSADPAAIALIAEAIQAMKSNVDPSAHPVPTGGGLRDH